MARKMNKKTRNVISGVMVGVASLFAIINFADIPADEVGSFLFSTALFFIGIIVLAFLTVLVFKGLSWLAKSFFSEDEEERDQNEERE